FSVFTGQIMINHSQFCFRGILWFSHKIAPYSVGCPTFGVQSSSAAGQAVPDSVPVVVPDGGYALSGLQSPVYQTVTHTVGPRKRSAAGQAVPDSVPVIVPDGGYALSGLPSSQL
ncbi:hypothetical protein, partial [Klebsiella pneumoniae]